MKKQWTIAIIVIAVPICFIAVFYLVGTFSSGSYPYAQQYQFNVNRVQLVKAVEKFKTENKSYNPPSVYNARDSIDTYVHNNFDAYVFYDEYSIVYFVINGQDANKSSINFISINEGLQSPVFKLINKDLDRNDNLRIKKEFEERVLNKLGLAYKDKGNGMFVFWK